MLPIPLAYLCPLQWQVCSPQYDVFYKCYENTPSHPLQVIKHTLNRAGGRTDPCRTLLARCLQAEHHT